ncbi:hypothetical protein GCM10012276_10240 [Nocardioides deserti]|nr:hypothetical protein GCM10012276_10240 [Nocardioides deserti]
MEDGEGSSEGAVDPSPDGDAEPVAPLDVDAPGSAVGSSSPDPQPATSRAKVSVAAQEGTSEGGTVRQGRVSRKRGSSGGLTLARTAPVARRPRSGGGGGPGADRTSAGLDTGRPATEGGADDAIVVHWNEGTTEAFCPTRERVGSTSSQGSAAADGARC